LGKEALAVSVAIRFEYEAEAKQRVSVGGLVDESAIGEK
jgi:hypothetical protein